jgi:hypothetical protein
VLSGPARPEDGGRQRALIGLPFTEPGVGRIALRP